MELEGGWAHTVFYMIKIEALYKEVDLWLWQLCLRESADTKNFVFFFLSVTLA